MSEIGYGYGSECHLLRWMGRHRSVFDKTILKEIGENEASIEWVDFKFDPKATWPDTEIKGLELLKSNQFLQTEWANFWPTQSGVPNWDAVGWLKKNDNRKELLLLEAKAHIEEIESDCQAKSKESLKKIDKAFQEVKKALDIVCVNDWKKRYYQFANRLAALYFLHSHEVAARLILLYFVGDKFPVKYNYKCPQSLVEWEDAFKEQKNYLGLWPGRRLDKQISTVFFRIDSEEL